MCSAMRLRVAVWGTRRLRPATASVEMAALADDPVALADCAPLDADDAPDRDPALSTVAVAPPADAPPAPCAPAKSRPADAPAPPCAPAESRPADAPTPPAALAKSLPADAAPTPPAPCASTSST